MAEPSVAIVHYTCPPVVGGVELLIAVHAGLFAARGHPTRVITGKGEPFRPDVSVRVIPSLYSKDPELLAINEELDRGLVSDRFHAAADRIYRALKAALEGVDLCVVHNAFTLHFNLPLTAALHRLVREGDATRFVAWCHDVSWKNELYVPKMREAFPWRLLKEPLDGVRYVVVSSARQAELAELFDLPRERFRVIPAGVDPATQLKLEPETADLVNRLGLLEGDLLMLAPVRITKRKNLEMGIRITRALLERDVRPRLVVTGPPGPHNVRSGDYVGELRRLRRDLGVEREVVFLFEHAPPPAAGSGVLRPRGGSAEDERVGEGPRPLPSGVEAGPATGDGGYWVSDRMMYDLYSLGDLLLFCSAQEGFGIPLLEAGLFRLPVFCTSIPPFREIGLDMVTYFELGDDPGAVAERIRSWMEADNSYRLRRRVLARYSWDSIFRDQIGSLLAGR